jgi:hypothetical protein
MKKEDILEYQKILTALTQGRFEQIKATEVAGLGVSTTKTPDMGYETAIVDADTGHPVERYPDLESALAGHEKWVARAVELTTVTELGWGPIVQPKEVQLKRRKQSTKWEN